MQRFILLGLIVLISACGSSPLDSTPRFSIDWPIDQARLTQRYKFGWRKHTGIDLAARKGTPIFAAHDGRVAYVGSNQRGYGKLIIIKYNKTWSTYYAHLDRFFVKKGDRVWKGKKIAAMGATGRATGSHLHFEIRKKNHPIDPLPFLP